MTFIDTHCHLYLASDKTEEDIINNFIASWWKYMICIWIDIETSKKAIELSKKYNFIYASIWIHPSDSIKFIWNLENTISELEYIYNENKDYIVAIWECWLDYFHTDLSDLESIENQKNFFKAQIDLANKLDLPVIIHNRESKNDILDIIKEKSLKNFIMHCFSEDLDYANKLIDYSPNCMISFSWIVTFNSAKTVQEASRNIPLKNIIVETDSPFLTPVPHRWKQENEPAFTKHVLEKLFDIKEESAENIENQILKNSEKIFWLKK